jgi:cytochrome c oxidase subunit IV
MSGHSHHVPSIGMCVRVWLALLVLTGFTIFIANQDLGALNTPVALLVAITKASLVILFFMGVKWNTPLTKTVAISGFVWLMILFAMGMNDYLTRGWLGVAGR